MRYLVCGPPTEQFPGASKNAISTEEAKALLAEGFTSAIAIPTLRSVCEKLLGIRVPITSLLLPVDLQPGDEIIFVIPDIDIQSLECWLYVQLPPTLD